MSKKKSESENPGLRDASLEELFEELARRRLSEDPDLASMEMAVQEAKDELGMAALQQMLDRIGSEEDNRPKKCPRCGKRCRVRSAKRARTLYTLQGEVVFTRNQHYCEQCEQSFHPLDEALDIPKEGRVSRELERRLADFVVKDSFEEGAERFNMHYDALQVSSKLVRNVANRLGRMVEACHDAALDHETLPVPATQPEQLIVQTDGCQLPMRGSEPWKEGKMAVIFRADKHLRGERGRRGEISQTRYVGVLGAQDEFRRRLDIALRIERSGSGKNVAWLGDGAPGNWSLARRLAPECTEILDWYHAIEHAVDCAKIVFGESSPWNRVWQETVARRLRAGDVRGLLSELETLMFESRGKRRQALKDLHRYYNKNASRMDYPDYVARQLPIGSGIVESAHRHVLQARMKNAGQHWSKQGGRRMVRLRCAHQTAGRAKFYRALRAAHRLTRTGKIPKVGWQKTRASNKG